MKKMNRDNTYQLNDTWKTWFKTYGVLSLVRCKQPTDKWDPNNPHRNQEQHRLKDKAISMRKATIDCWKYYWEQVKIWHENLIKPFLC